MGAKNTPDQATQPLDRRTVLASIGERGIIAGISGPVDGESGRATVADSSVSAVAAAAEKYLQADTVADLGVAASGSAASVSSDHVGTATSGTGSDPTANGQLGTELDSQIATGHNGAAFDATMGSNGNSGAQTLTHAQRLRVELHNELARRGLLVERNPSEGLLAAVSASGEPAYQRLRSVADGDWEAVLTTARSALTADDCERIAGYGRVLTEFLVSPIDMPDEARETVLELGATMNLLVATFDRLIDAGHDPDDVLTSYGVRAALTRNNFVDRAYERVVPRDRRAIYRLLSAYAHGVDNLPYAGARGQVSRDIDECISDMHQAGRELWYRPGDAEADRTTSVNSIVILGLPGWLATSDYSESRYHRYVDWVENVGRFFGLVDDTADLSQDMTVGAHNAVQSQLESRSDRVVVERIANEGERVFDEWTEMTTHTDGERDLGDLFRGTIKYWLAPDLG